jgi:hypothetical protein
MTGHRPYRGNLWVKEKGRGEILYTQPLVNDEAHHSSITA